MQTHPQIFAICRGIVTPLFGVNHPDYKMVPSGIKKSAIDPNAGSILVKTLGIEGDEQADFNVHGGQEKAIYAYPREHYDFWEDYLKTPKKPKLIPIVNHNQNLRFLSEVLFSIIIALK